MNETTDLLAELDKAAESNIIRITPEMRAKIAEEGLPSFAFGGAVQKKGIENLPIMPRRPGIVRGIGSI